MCGCCAPLGGSSSAAASPGWVFACGCAPLGGSSPAAALPRVGLLPLLRCCGCEAGRPPKGPRPADGTGLGWALGTRLRGTQDSAFVRECSKDAAFATGSRRERSINRVGAREGRIVRPPGDSCGGWSVLLPSRGPFHDDGESLPLRGQSRRHDSSFARHGPREGSIVKESRAEGESWPRPAHPPEPRPTAPVEALSEADPLGVTATQQRTRTRPRPAHPAEPRPTAPVEALSENETIRSHSDAAASGRPAERRSSEQEPSRAQQTHPGRDPPLRSRPSRRRTRLAATATQPQVDGRRRRSRRTRRPTPGSYARGCANRYAARSRSVLTCV